MKITGYWEGEGNIVRETTSFDRISETIDRVEEERLDRRLVEEAQQLVYERD